MTGLNHVTMLMLFSVFCSVTTIVNGQNAAWLEAVGLEAADRGKRANCGVESELTDQQKRDAVDTHNAKRRLHRPADMMKLSWDDDLAARAQEWANKCTWGHDMTSDCSGNYAGQNGWMTGPVSADSTPIMSSVVGSWYDEIKDWDLTTMTCKKAWYHCGHYTQVVSSSTQRVGCGSHFCPFVVSQEGTSRYVNSVLVFCNYQPSGTRKFTQGRACSTCPNNCDDGLCVECKNVKPRSSCYSWVGVGHCEKSSKYYKFMMDNCAAACGFCQSTDECKNIQPESKCRYWVRVGHCKKSSKHYGFMRDKCAAACRFCTPA